MMYGFYSNDTIVDTLSPVKRALAVGCWLLIMGYAQFSDAKVSTRVIELTKQTRHLDKIVSLISAKAESEGEYELDAYEVCTTPWLVKKYDIAIECVNYIDDELDCNNPKDSEEIEGCQAGEE